MRTLAVLLAPAAALLLLSTAPAARGQAFGLSEISKESKECIECHKKQNLVIYQQWGSSKHFRANVACYECHSADKNDPDAFNHYEQWISVLVTPKDCSRCHSREVGEFVESHHAKAGRILGSLDNVLAEVVEGNNAFRTPGFPQGNSAAAVNGCWQCHGSQVKVLPGGRLDPATYPNSGIGRLNPDGTEGSCHACHTRHSFSAAQARHPDTCGKCHLGPDHPQKEIYEESKHGILFFSNEDKMNLANEKWVVGEDYWAAPTCATCHMSATRTQDVTHDVGERISWNNRPPISIRPEVSDAKMGLRGAAIPWQVRRDNMQDVCLNCHNKNWVDGFYTQYDALIELYNTKFAKPAGDLYALAQPLKDVQFAFTTEADWAYWELWHHEGRRARHGASMMAPDYTHWHGTYDVAKTFYTHYVPALREMVEDGLASGDDEKIKAAQALEEKLNQVLNSPDHRWFVGGMSEEEKARRSQAADEFKSRYKN
ncbi:MAG: hydroxylamine oxidoreductase [Planctomycetes bacterium]|nr:hydroxylamine oxidoreductase [Planctomycetota bacterium]NOG56089.1 hydroxylamine oxidoreductase [Planctomycetota bacterium]